MGNQVSEQEEFVAGKDGREWYAMGRQYEHRASAAVDRQKAIDAYQQGAEQNNADCQTRLGKHLLWGEIVQKDEAQAYQWFCKAAEQDHEIAKMYKGHCLLYGLGVEKNASIGKDLLYGALDYNYPSAGESQEMAEKSQFDWEEDMMQLFWDLGDAHENGLGVMKRAHLAGYYFNMVADAGWPEAIEKMTHYKKGLFGRWKKIK